MTALLSLFFFFRPIMFIDIGWLVFGLNINEVFAIFATGILIIAFILRVISAKRLNISSVDFFLFAFVTWVFFIYVLYIDRSLFKDAAKFVLPFITYFVLKNVIVDTRQYSRLIKIMLIGFAVPIISSTFLIVQGKSLYTILYWNNLARFKGVYNNCHDLGHCMAMFLMLIGIYAVICSSDTKLKPLRRQRLFVVFLAMLSVFAFYCLYKSYVRTCFFGFILFAYYYLFRVNKRVLIVLTAVMCAISILSAAVLYTIFYDMIDSASGKESAENFGSGRPYIWKHNIIEFSSQGLDEILAGVGVGNTWSHTKRKSDVVGGMLNSHNDFLDVMMQTGLVGIILFLAFQFCIYRKIRLLEGRVRYIFLALFFAVCFMNFASNSYVTRFGLGQIFYAVLSYIELPDHRKEDEKLGGIEVKVSEIR
ncbi:O-antigen ligase family protein [Maridesulfovibrio zosterae]|uniref:O-antigen ligase family protein n=1 Tax=Maridesulfovibrio zosterae TaxID=82171 RepID=UPI0003FFED98|nr:O-antigen ligase family protein [Maridesulfovibrio zosterae]